MTLLLAPDWFAGDHHFGHQNIIRFEPDARGHYNSVKHMNSDIVARHNALVGVNDTVLFLGDLAMGDLEDSLGWVGLMNGDKYLIPGNHDRPHPLMTKNPDRVEAFTRMYEDAGVTVLPREIEVDIWGHTVLASHYPYRGVIDGGLQEATKHDKWRPEPSAQPLVHGHIHIQRLIKDNMYNVGIGMRDLEPTPAAVLAGWLSTL